MSYESQPTLGSLVINKNARVKTSYGVEYSETYPKGLVVSVDSEKKQCDVLWPAGFVNTQDISALDVIKQGFGD